MIEIFILLIGFGLLVFIGVKKRKSYLNTIRIKKEPIVSAIHQFICIIVETESINDTQLYDFISGTTGYNLWFSEEEIEYVIKVHHKAIHLKLVIDMLKEYPFVTVKLDAERNKIIEWFNIQEKSLTSKIKLK